MRIVHLCVSIVCLAGVFSCGGDDKSPPDLRAPTSVLLVAQGPAKAKAETSPFVATAEQVRLHIQADEDAYVVYTIDRSEPKRGSPNSTVGKAPTIVTISRPTVIRWFTVDNAGNQELTQQFEVSFDNDIPTLTVEPPPGAYPNAVVVKVSANEPATLYWTADGRRPLPGHDGTRSGRLPVEFDVQVTSTLKVIAVDAGGNRTRVESWRYQIDTEPPKTVAEPAGGAYLAPVQVRLSTDDVDATIRYTTDGRAPNDDAPIYQGPIEIDRSLTLRFSATDRGGNHEEIHSEAYTIGPRGQRDLAQVGDPYIFDSVGNLALSTALLKASGPLSGDLHAPEFGHSWTAWAIARNAIDALFFQSGVGPSAMHGPAINALVARGDGPGDVDDDGTQMDDALDARLQSLATRAGAELPDGLYVSSMIYPGARSRLLRPTSGRLLDDGRPDWVKDFGQLRWQGTRVGDRALTAGATGAGLSALAARAYAATTLDHRTNDSVFATQVQPVVGLRCGQCHQTGGISPALVSAVQWRAAGLFEDAGGQPVLAAMLAGDLMHPVDPAPEEQVAAVTAWIAAGAAVSPSAVGPGVTADDGFLGLLAIETAMHVLTHLNTHGIYHVDDRVLAGLPDERSGRQYVSSYAEVTEGAGVGTTPLRVQRIKVIDRAFRTEDQVRLLQGALDIYVLRRVRSSIFIRPPLAPSATMLNAPEQAERLIRQQVRMLLALVFDGELGVFVDRWHPEEGRSADVNTTALADAITVLLQARDLGPSGLGITTQPGLSVTFLHEVLQTEAGDYASNSGDLLAPRRLQTQLAVLRALLTMAERGVGQEATLAGEAAEALWDRLESDWWDAIAGTWQSTLGDMDYRYTPALAARAVETLTLGIGRLPNAEDRLARFFEEVIQGGLVNAETWLNGEIGMEADADADGIPKPSGVPDGNGAAPVFAHEVAR